MPKRYLRCVSNPDAGLDTFLNNWYQDAKTIFFISSMWNLSAANRAEHFIFYVDEVSS